MAEISEGMTSSAGLTGTDLCNLYQFISQPIDIISKLITAETVMIVLPFSREKHSRINHPWSRFG